jgi:bifunctional ADP-heptose synthase (sugar kinase/adenylyltransferase)
LINKYPTVQHHRGETVVMVTGAFDILHLEHIRFFTRAKAAGSKLVVGLEADSGWPGLKVPAGRLIIKPGAWNKFSLSNRSMRP